MSTKFRQSFILLCDDCRRSSKDPRSGAMVLYRDHNGKYINGVHALGGVRTISTTGKFSHQPPILASQIQEKKSLIVDNTPITPAPIDDVKFVF